MFMKKNIVMIVKRVEKPFIPIYVKESNKIIEDFEDDSSEEDFGSFELNKSQKSIQPIMKKKVGYKKSGEKKNYCKKKSKIVSLSLSSIITWISSLPSLSDGINVLTNPFFLGFLLFSLFLLNNLKR